MNTLIEELRGYKYVKAKRRIRKGEILRTDDHYADAFRYFLVSQGHPIKKKPILPRIIKTVLWLLAIGIFIAWLYISR